MPEIVKGTFEYEQDSKRFHRFQIRTTQGVVGTIYIPKTMQPIPDRIELVKQLEGGDT